MNLIDFILNVTALMLWLSWRALRFDPLRLTSPATLAGTLKRTEDRRLKSWQFLAGLTGLLLLRSWIYFALGTSIDWTPRLNLGIVVLAFRSDLFASALLFSLFSFIRALMVFYCWLLALVVLDRGAGESDPVGKLLRLHLGRLAALPWWAQLPLPVVAAAGVWMASHPLLAQFHAVQHSRSIATLAYQGLLVGVGLMFTLKYLLPPLLSIYLVASYVYLGRSPVWEFVAHTARNLLRPLRPLPLRIAKLDLAPVAGILGLLFLLHWLPALILRLLAERKLSLWPQ